jgi:cephalosporin hydroxylase
LARFPNRDIALARQTRTIVTAADDRATFEESKQRQAVALGRDREAFAASVKALLAADKYDYSYLWSWMGVPIIQFPADVLATQEVIWVTKPDVIVETGVARGGSVLFMASVPSKPISRRPTDSRPTR